MSDYSRGKTPMTTANGNVARDETAALISSDKVEGTSVLDKGGNKLGSIHSLMIGKKDGRVSYAVLSFGGFLGMGRSYFPIPWSQLSYSPQYDGYVTSLTEAQLTNAPKYDTAESSSWSDAAWRGNVDNHYRSSAM
jgi:hypothetical protein